MLMKAVEVVTVFSQSNGACPTYREYHGIQYIYGTYTVHIRYTYVVYGTYTWYTVHIGPILGVDNINPVV